MRTIGAVFLVAIFLVANGSNASRVFTNRRYAERQDPARVTKKDPDFRCSDRAKPTEEQCRKERMNAWEKGCISNQELALLTQYNGCPVCLGAAYKGWCPVGCFVRGTKIMAKDLKTETAHWIPVEEIVEHSHRYRVASLVPGSSPSSPQFQFLPIRLTTVGPEEEPLVIIATASKRILGLTSTHAVALADGRLLAASALKTGDELISLDGSTDIVSEISRPMTEDMVFNLSVESDEDQAHLILAEGLLVGDQFLQDSLLLNSTILK